MKYCNVLHKNCTLGGGGSGIQKITYNIKTGDQRYIEDSPNNIKAILHIKQQPADNQEHNVEKL